MINEFGPCTARATLKAGGLIPIEPGYRTYSLSLFDLAVK
jgi:hypothetical protein